MSFNYSADYKYIDIALKSRWEPFTSLAQEMKDFVPRSFSDYAGERAQLFDQASRANPTSSTERINEYVDGQISYRALPDAQVRARFEERFIAEYVTVAMLSHALCEAAINAILALGLAQVGSQGLFAVLERAGIKPKWLYGPKSFSPDWTLPQELGHTLHQLTKDRNALTHHKVTLEKFQGARLIEGSRFQRKSYAEESTWLRRFFNLPYDLAHHALGNLSNSPPFFLDRQPIEQARETPP
jgi:hypothetical protein